MEKGKFNLFGFLILLCFMLPIFAIPLSVLEQSAKDTDSHKDKLVESPEIGAKKHHDIAIENKHKRGVDQQLFDETMMPEYDANLLDNVNFQLQPDSVFNPAQFYTEPLSLPVAYRPSFYDDLLRKKRSMKKMRAMRYKRQTTLTQADLFALLKLAKENRVEQYRMEPSFDDYGLNYDMNPMMPYQYKTPIQQKGGFYNNNNNNHDDNDIDNGEWMDSWTEPSYNIPAGSLERFNNKVKEYQQNQKRFMVAKKKRSPSPHFYRSRLQSNPIDKEQPKETPNKYF